MDEWFHNYMLKINFFIADLPMVGISQGRYDDFLRWKKKLDLIETATRNIEVDSIPLDNFEFSVRTSRVMRENGFTTIGCLRKRTRSYVLSLSGFGRKSLNEVCDAINPVLGLFYEPKLWEADYNHDGGE